MKLRLRYILLLVFIFIVSSIVSLVFRLGVFKSVEVSMVTQLELRMLYKVHTGAYHKISQTIEEVESIARAQSIPCQSYGEFLDNPQVVEEIRLKSHGGCLVNEDLANAPADLTFEKRPPKDYIKAVFDGSPSISPYKVYPKIQEYAYQARLKLNPHVIEIYYPSSDGLTGRTEYLQEVLR